MNASLSCRYLDLILGLDFSKKYTNHFYYYYKLIVIFDYTFSETIFQYAVIMARLVGVPGLLWVSFGGGRRLQPTIW